jgi:hypothetical protein
MTAVPGDFELSNMMRSAWVMDGLQVVIQGAFALTERVLRAMCVEATRPFLLDVTARCFHDGGALWHPSLSMTGGGYSSGSSGLGLHAGWQRRLQRSMAAAGHCHVSLPCEVSGEMLL